MDQNLKKYYDLPLKEFQCIQTTLQTMNSWNVYSVGERASLHAFTTQTHHSTVSKLKCWSLMKTNWKQEVCTLIIVVTMLIVENNNISCDAIQIQTFTKIFASFSIKITYNERQRHKPIGNRPTDHFLPLIWVKTQYVTRKKWKIYISVVQCHNCRSPCHWKYFLIFFVNFVKFFKIFPPLFFFHFHCRCLSTLSGWK